MAPALILLGVWVVYPAIATMVRSLYNDAGSKFVWFDNYDRMFSDALIRTAIKNNFLWVLAIPLTVTAFGLIFAVLTERIAWAPAFKVVIFLPLAISLFAVGVIWRVMYQQDPSRGVINATIGAVRDAFKPAGVLSRAQPSSDALVPGSGGSIVFDRPVGPGGVVRLGLTGMSATEIPESATQAVDPKPQSGAITGVVWRDFKPGGGVPGKVEQEEVGLPGVTVELRDASGKQVDSAKTGDDGSFAFAGVNSGAYKVGIGGSTFAQPFKGVNCSARS